MRLRLTVAAGAITLLAAAPASASAAQKQTVRCVGTADGCGATVPIAGGARGKLVTVKLTDTNLKLESVTAVSAVKNGYDLSQETYRAGGSEFRFTLTAAKANPKRARIVLVFSNPGAPPASAPTGALRGGWKWFDARFSVGAGQTVTITGGGDGTSVCTREETTETFVTRGNDESRRLVYYSKGDGGCAMQLSYSEFRVQIRNPAGQLTGSGRLFYGQQYVAGDYVVSCDYGPWVGARCSSDDSPAGGPGAQIKR
ncbi:hypothetical protein Q5424_25775 [Conexibacter sp. JD483]|uniref:hypothetical protein n=1 Tax=unclassified Conexibacter TaxID=2627773 RepID=UPI0027274922|nr:MULTISPECIES: hypothetical protein [unclassified Conexibacter]MDO8189417.1 hypothetical protein [Conexibacter sp. CPCC 205706]MDO8200771.1 hypothetical protein [Conexibacter sp. CPCC 205762]MDR9372534.1 hypothetical protein [Conexibacter sp. JD483]